MATYVAALLMGATVLIIIKSQILNMSEIETKEVETKVVKEETSVIAETKVHKTAKKSAKSYVVAGLVVLLIIFGVLYLLEKEGRSSTNIFAGVLASQEAKAVVVVINGEEVVNSELEVSIQQFSLAAEAQGVDINDPEAKAEIRDQALDVLINTKLLKQVAAENNTEVSDDEVSERLSAIETDMGGAEVLEARMLELDIDADQLRKDIHDEILIQKVLDTVFAEANIEVTEEEVVALYDGAGGEEAGLPALDDVRAEIEAQIRSTKEQAAIDAYLNVLKEEAEVEVI